MASTSVDGLISGLNTTDVINQLMQLERAPQTRLKAQRSSLDKSTAAYQALNARFESVRQAAAALSSASGWTSMKATTSDSSRITAVAVPGALPADLTVRVEQLATSHTLVSERAALGLDEVVASGPLVFTVGGQPTAPIDVGGGSLREVVAAINAADIGVRAAAVQVAQGRYRLQLSASATGAAGAFTVDSTPLAALADPLESPGDPEAFDVVVQGVDARVRFGGAFGYTVESTSNTFADVLAGVTLTVQKADPLVDVSVSVSQDVDALVGKVKVMVDAVNGAFKYIADSTAFDASTGAKGLLLGDSLTRRLQQDLYGALRPDITGRSLADVGLGLGASGLTVDEDELRAALASDPSAVIEAFTGASTVADTDGLATKIAAIGTKAADPHTGLVTIAISATGNRAVDLDQQIESWDVRLASREATLRRQFAALETALGNLQNQSSWLAGQLAGLPSWGDR
jgi:flagellar hook-associated protein 2